MYRVLYNANLSQALKQFLQLPANHPTNAWY